MWYFWIRRQVRRYMRPIPLAKASKYDNILTVIYVFSAWTACGIALYQFVKVRKSETNVASDALSSGFYYGRQQRAQNLQIFRVSGGGVEKAGTFTYDPNAEEHISKQEFFGEDE